VVAVPGLRAVTGRTMSAPAVIAVAAVVVLAGPAGCTPAGMVTVGGAHDGTGASQPSSSPFSPGPATSSPAPAAQAGSAAQLLQRARDAFAGASSVHVTGTAVHGADAYVLDVRLAGADGGRAKIEASGQTVDVTRIGDVAYVSGDLPFWRFVMGDETKARQMTGSWLRTPASAPNFASFVQFTQPSTYAAVLPDPSEPATVTGLATIRRTSVTGVRDGDGSTLYVATSTPGYPMRLDGLSGGKVVFLDFSEYGGPVSLRAPRTARATGPGHGS
jgi:hypothetical protein